MTIPRQLCVVRATMCSTEQTSAYLQDRWQPAAGLTLSLGLRCHSIDFNALFSGDINAWSETTPKGPH